MGFKTADGFCFIVACLMLRVLESKKNMTDYSYFESMESVLNVFQNLEQRNVEYYRFGRLLFQQKGSQQALLAAIFLLP